MCICNFLQHNELEFKPYKIFYIITFILKKNNVKKLRKACVFIIKVYLNFLMIFILKKIKRN